MLSSESIRGYSAAFEDELCKKHARNSKLLKGIAEMKFCLQQMQQKIYNRKSSLPSITTQKMILRSTSEKTTTSTVFNVNMVTSKPRANKVNIVSKITIPVVDIHPVKQIQAVLSTERVVSTKISDRITVRASSTEKNSETNMLKRPLSSTAANDENVPKKTKTPMVLRKRTKKPMDISASSSEQQMILRSTSKKSNNREFKL